MHRGGRDSERGGREGGEGETVREGRERGREGGREGEREEAGVYHSQKRKKERQGSWRILLLCLTEVIFFSR